jgi:hypothetical protein
MLSQETNPNENEFPHRSCSLEFIDEFSEDERSPGPSYIATLEQAREIPAVSWEKDGLFLTLTGYWYFFNRSREAKIGVSEYLRSAGFVSILAKNKQVTDPYERSTLWVSPENKLITRREYSKHQYLAKKKGQPVKDHLIELGYFRLKDTESKIKPGE